MKISLSKFVTLRPQQYILAGPKGTHNVCVCKIHENIRLKFLGIKLAFVQTEYKFTETYRNFLQNIVCEISTHDCFLSTCKSCPDIEIILNNLNAVFLRYKIDKITFMQWKQTDSYVHTASITFQISIFFSSHAYIIFNSDANNQP